VTADQRLQAAHAYMDALRAIAESTRTLREPRISWLHPIARTRQISTKRTASKAFVGATIDGRYAQNQIADLAVGASGNWGLLSSLPHSQHAVEDLLLTIIDDRATALRDSLALVRAQVELGIGMNALARAEEAAAALAEDYRVLHDFLPVHARPKVTSANHLERSTDLITFLVTEREPGWDAPYPHVRLHDIVSRVQSGGLGTAALQELCAYADRQGLPVTADFVPGFDADAARILRLARWYHRHGFRQGDRSPEAWTPTTAMRRDPIASLRTPEEKDRR
jgi:hypothetical protein